MDSWVIEVTDDALNRMREHASLVGLVNTDEATFRSFFVASLVKRYPSALAQTEWHTYDLLVQRDECNTLIEFKYYLYRRTIELDGRPGESKGGAGVQNEREFRACVNKLHARTYHPIHGRYVVLVYDPQSVPPPRKSFDASYGRLSATKLVVNVVDIRCNPLMGKIIEVQ